MSQCIICIFLGQADINKESQQKKAVFGQNLSLAINILSVTANILISSFEMRSMDDYDSIKLLANIK